MEPIETVFRSRPEATTLVAIGLAAVAVVVFCTQLAYVAGSRGPTMFGARSQVQYQGTSWVETQSERINSRTLLGPVALANGIEIGEFENSWTAGQVLGTQILQFEYRHPDPDVALSIVESVTGRYLAEAELAASAPNLALEAYEELERDLLDELAVVEASIADLGDVEVSARLTALFQEKASLRASIDAVRLAMAQVRIFDRAELVPQLVTEPFVLTDPVGPLPARRAVFGFLGGVILASGLAFLALRTAGSRRQHPRMIGPAGAIGFA